MLATRRYRVCFCSDWNADGLKEPYAQALDTILATECCGGDLDSGAYRLQQVELDVQAYQLHPPFEHDGSQQAHHLEDMNETYEDGPKARALALPSKELDGIWESYVYHIAPENSSLTVGMEDFSLTILFNLPFSML